ncbi:PilN domain-containing protein [Vibrio sp. Isolate23]|uniref:PilN domain-containing protein n=1 Tax=Vibrio sp. Isolate23 TaxID=2908533 RepID=UPI001EFD3E4A|nr:PilN domain-containing protein [Vibrio sp. Isolate23]MCG9684588.1 PilN domain-containing protein [Vibrio sp. Isolate23]
MQPEINLIPWRADQRQQRIRHLVFSLSFVVLIASLVVVTGEHYLQSQIRLQQSRVEQLKNWGSHLDQKVSQVNAIEQKVAALKGEIIELQELHAQRYFPLQLIALLPELLPESVYLDHINLVGRQVSLAGIAETAEQLNELLANLQRSPMIEGVKLQSVVHGVQRFSNIYQSFSLTFELVERSYD